MAKQWPLLLVSGLLLRRQELLRHPSRQSGMTTRRSPSRSYVVAEENRFGLGRMQSCGGLGTGKATFKE